MNIQKLSLKMLIVRFRSILNRFRRFAPLIFIGFVVMLYGFVLLRINSLTTLEPSAEAVTSQVKAAQIPHLDKAVVEQLNSLQDNSVSVQALFNEARSNPFQ